MIQIIENKKIVNKWFGDNYERLKQICRNVSKLYEVDELLHFCIFQAHDSKSFNQIEHDKEKFYFFTRIVQNNFHSVKSPYHLTYRKQKVVPDVELVDIPTDNVDIDMEWVVREIEQLKKDKWYYGRIFELYIEEGCNLGKLSTRTTIPVNSLSRDIKYVRQILNKKRKQDLYGM